MKYILINSELKGRNEKNIEKVLVTSIDDKITWSNQKEDIITKLLPSL